MKVTFLGTGTSQGVPVISCQCAVCTSKDPKDNRLRSSVLLEKDGFSLVIDTGPDFRTQMLRGAHNNLDAVLFTHEHKDHIAGLDDIRPFNFIQKKKIDVYATDRVQNALRREFHYIFADIQYPGIPQINLHEVTLEPFSIGPFDITPIQLYHHKLPVLGYRIGDFTYITDANRIDYEEKDKVKGSKVLVLNSLRREEHISHFTFQQVLDLMEEFRPEQGLLTHISHQLGKYEDLIKELPENVRPAYDELSILMD